MVSDPVFISAYNTHRSRTPTAWTHTYMDFWKHLERDYSLRKSFILQFNESFFSLHLLNIFLWCPPVWLVSKKLSHWMTGCRSSNNLVKTCGLIIQKVFRAEPQSNYELWNAVLSPTRTVVNSINFSEPLKGFKVCIFSFCREEPGDVSQYGNWNLDSFQDFTLTLAFCTFIKHWQ